MQNSKMKKGLALALATSMVVGSSLTVFAADSGTTGGTTGTGSSEGHVDTHVINVELPTIPAGSTPFNYTMDAERLIQDTDGAKYGNATFPAAASDTGVYFLTGETEATTTYTKKATKPDDYTDSDFDTLPVNPDADAYAALTSAQQACYDVTTTPATKNYGNTSEELKVTSKSSADVKLTVEVAAADQATDIDLVDSAPAADVTDPQLYLALKVGGTTKAIKAGETISSDVTIAGKDDNFEKTYKDDKYVYAEKTTTVYKKLATQPGEYAGADFDTLAAELSETDYNALDEAKKVCYEATETSDNLVWNESKISLTGAVSKASAKDLTAPVLTVTWKYEDPAKTVPGGLFYQKSTNDWWLGTTADAGFAKGITLGDVTVNDQPITGHVTEYQGEDWVVIKWSDYVAAGYDKAETEYDFTAVVNGITYTFHYTYTNE